MDLGKNTNEYSDNDNASDDVVFYGLLNFIPKIHWPDIYLMNMLFVSQVCI